jgi:hypothetical protein|tara:strand:+ start:219 stop:506 length:288 start_codon:yes stop_codon:yes gene_type:complete
LSTNGAQLGSVLTKSFLIDGSRQQVNAQGEHIRVEVLDKNAKKSLAIPPSLAKSTLCDGTPSGSTAATWLRCKANSSWLCLVVARHLVVNHNFSG